MMNTLSILHDIASARKLRFTKDIVRFSRKIGTDVVVQCAETRPIFIDFPSQPTFDFSPFFGACIPSVLGVGITIDRTSCSIQGLSELAHVFPNLVYLKLGPLSAKTVADLDLSHFRQLRRLEFGKVKAEFTPWATVPNLRSCALEGFAGSNLNGFVGVDGLVTLEITSARNLTSLAGLESLRTLKFLHIHQAPGLTDISALTHCTGIESLRIEKAKALGSQDEVFLSLPNLKCLHVDQVSGYRRYLHAPALRKIFFKKDTTLKSQMIVYEDHEFLEQINDDGEPQRMFWDAYAEDVFLT